MIIRAGLDKTVWRVMSGIIRFPALKITVDEKGKR